LLEVRAVTFHITVEDEADIVWYRNRPLAEELITMAAKILEAGGRVLFEHRPQNAPPIPVKSITDETELERWAKDLRARLDLE
jgi:hypothetical protein